MATETARGPQFFQKAKLKEMNPLPGLVARYVAGDKLMALFGEVEPNGSLPLHSHPHEQISYVVAGSVHFEMDGVGYDMVPGDGLVVPGGVEHGAVRVGPEGCTIIEIFTPLRENYLALMQETESNEQ